MHKILIIDDEKDICFLISEILKDEDKVYKKSKNINGEENTLRQHYCVWQKV